MPFHTPNDSHYVFQLSNSKAALRLVNEQDTEAASRSDSPTNAPANMNAPTPGAASISGNLLAFRSASPLATNLVSEAPPVTNQGQAPAVPVKDGDPKPVVAIIPKPKQYVYTFPSPPPDTHDLLSEVEEFYSYVEVPQVFEHRDSFLQSWPHATDFSSTPEDLQLEHIRSLLKELSNPDDEIRFSTARHLTYIAQGTFQASTSPEHHLLLILSNVGLLRTAGTLQVMWEAVKRVGQRWEAASTLPDPAAQVNVYAAQDRQDKLDGINGELALYLAVLYLMVEMYRGDEEWAEELMRLEPPMPIYLFNLVASLREKNAKGYPVKKLLLLLWKSILCCFGGMKDITRVKAFVREVEGLPPDDKPSDRVDPRPNTKVAPPDYQNFRNEITSKYPSYQPAPIPNVDLDRISAAASPSPIRATFSYHINSMQDPNMSGPNPTAPLPQHNPPPGTPAPTPPQSPLTKPKKQQFQTDQTRPFVLPFSPANAGPKGKPRVVPQSIEEAGELYRNNMRISTELWQTWKLREEYVADESGIIKAEAIAAKLEQVSAGSDGARSRDAASRLSRRLSALAIDDSDDEREEDLMDPLNMLKALEKSMRAEENEEKDEKKKKLLTQKRVDVQRLERIEVFYRAVLQNMQSAVIVLLKLLLATVTANSNNPHQQQNGQPESGIDETIELNLEDTDIMRHREITSKAVSAILILCLKWLKTSHVMKFHYLSQLLVDSNCLLLILKMFGLQEASTTIRVKHERPDYNFFKYCNDRINPPPPGSPRPEDAMLEANPPGARPASQAGDNDDEIELVTDFSWRNFFSVINFVHILQKLTKRKTHRVLLLVQYKSSAILKRILKVSHPTLQLYVLKVIKSQVPYCGRKWRQTNMKVITAIYLHCRPDLRDEWLTGVDVDADVEESLPREQALRALVRFFNTKHYGAYAPHLHRRSSSANHPPPEFRQIPQSPSGQLYSDNDVFPPVRSVRSFDPESPLRSYYGSDSPEELGEYEVDDLLFPRLDGDGELEMDPAGSRAAWDRLGELLGHFDDISDSESVGSFGFMGFGNAPGGDDSSDGSVSDFDMDDDLDERQARSEWAHISPETITALEEERNAISPLSPRPRRRSSTGPISPALRPVLIDRDDDANPMEEVEDGPVPAAPHSGLPVDEVELVFGE